MDKVSGKFLAERAESLAYIYLSRRGDLAIERPREDFGVDFVVRLKGQGSSLGRMFGIETKALAGDKPRAAWRQGYWNRFREFPYPVCLFVFTMQNDKGYFSWIKQPDPTGTLKFIGKVRSEQLQALSDQGLAGILSSVRSWYDARHTS